MSPGQELRSSSCIVGCRYQTMSLSIRIRVFVTKDGLFDNKSFPRYADLIGIAGCLELRLFTYVAKYVYKQL